MSVKLQTEHHLEFLSLKWAAQALSLHMSKCHIVGNHMSQLVCTFISYKSVVLIYFIAQSNVMLPLPQWGIKPSNENSRITMK